MLAYLQEQVVSPYDVEYQWLLHLFRQADVSCEYLGLPFCGGSSQAVYSAFSDGNYLRV